MNAAAVGSVRLVGDCAFFSRFSSRSQRQQDFLCGTRVSFAVALPFVKSCAPFGPAGEPLILGSPPAPNMGRGLRLRW